VDAVSLKAKPEKQITPKQLEAIRRGITATGTDPQRLLEYYYVGALAELTRDQAGNAIRILDLKSASLTGRLNAVARSGVQSQSPQYRHLPLFELCIADKPTRYSCARLRGRTSLMLGDG
jgi:hypothetical protein